MSRNLKKGLIRRLFGLLLRPRKLLSAFERQVMRLLARRMMHEIQSTPYVYGQFQLKTGRDCGLANTIFNLRSGSITLGDNVIFGHHCMVLAGAHSADTLDGFRPTEDSGRDVKIGDNVFIGSGSIIVGPVEIEKNAVIAAGSMVVRHVPANTLVAGNPARPIRNLDFNEALVDAVSAKFPATTN